jgi:hypothetical protein
MHYLSIACSSMDGHLRSQLEMGVDLGGSTQVARAPVVHTGAEFRPQSLSNRQLANARLQIEARVGNLRNQFAALQDHNYAALRPASLGSNAAQTAQSAAANLPQKLLQVTEDHHKSLQSSGVPAPVRSNATQAALSALAAAEANHPQQQPMQIAELTGHPGRSG